MKGSIGRSYSGALLSPGTYTTLQATDSDGNTGTDEITNLVMTP